MAKSYKDTTGGAGREVVYIVCPLCGRNRALEVKTRGKGRLRWDFWNGNSPLIQIREAGGKIANTVKGGHLPGKASAIGFPLKATLSWEEVKLLPEFNDQLQEIQKQIQKIQKICK